MPPVGSRRPMSPVRQSAPTCEEWVLTETLVGEVGAVEVPAAHCGAPNGDFSRNVHRAWVAVAVQN